MRLNTTFRRWSRGAALAAAMLALGALSGCELIVRFDESKLLDVPSVDAGRPEASAGEGGADAATEAGPGMDAARDATAPQDAQADAAREAGGSMDASADASADVAMDVGPEAAPADAAQEASSDAASMVDAGSDASTD